ncbi:MAG TPA: hypothetical protein DDW31_06600 [candidate division Zixibacteria bacterium]|nr:hypothetical protein [candidate division Zixibacteria bacterium]
MDFVGFQYPWAWALLPLAAVPWLLHLLRRRRFRRIPFPSLMLLTEQQVVVWRRHRLEELLLLAIRTLMVVVLVAVLARPLVRGGLPGWLSPAEQWAVVILDDSASMASGRGGITAMDVAKRGLDKVLKGLGTGSRVAVVGGGRGTPVLSGFVAPGAASRAIEAAEPREAGTDLAGALAAADRMLVQAKSPLIIMASDFQRSSLGGTGGPVERLESKARVVLVDAGLKPPPANLTWLSVTASSLRGRLAVDGRWTGEGPARVSLEQGGRVVHRTSAAVLEDGSFSIGMELPSGDSLCLRAQDDGLALDNAYYLGGSGAAGKMCLVAAEADAPGQALLARALESLSGAGWRWKRTMSPGPGDLRQADVILVAASRLEEPLIEVLSGAVGPGKGAVVIVPLQDAPDRYNRLLAGLGSAANLLMMIQAGEQPQRLTPGPSGLGPEWDARSAGAVQVSRYWRAAYPVPAALMIGGRDPGLVLEESSRGPLVLWLFGIDPSMSDLAYRPAFPVMLHRSLEHAGEWCRAVQFHAGDTLRLRQELAGGLAVPGGGSLPGVTENRMRSWALDKPGWYRVSGPGGRRVAAANLPSGESDLEPLEPEKLAAMLAQVDWAAEGAGPGRSGPGQPAWRALLLLALLLLAGESGLRIRLAGQKNG